MHPLSVNSELLELHPVLKAHERTAFWKNRTNRNRQYKWLRCQRTNSKSSKVRSTICVLINHYFTKY